MGSGVLRQLGAATLRFKPHERASPSASDRLEPATLAGVITSNVMHGIASNLAVCLTVAISIGPSGLAAAPAHEEGGKLEYLADHLSGFPLVFDPLNLELVDELKLTEDGQLETQIQTRVGVLATSDLFVSGDHAYVGSFVDAVHIVDISRPDQLKLVARVPHVRSCRRCQGR